MRKRVSRKPTRAKRGNKQSVQRSVVPSKKAGHAPTLTDRGGMRATVQGQLLEMQRTHGNSQIARFVEYNATGPDGRQSDPEVARGVLPFTASGWNGVEIGRNVSQLNLADRTGDHRCVEASFLVALIQRGPNALKGMIENYIARYRGGIRRETTPEDIKSWYRRSIARLNPMIGRIDDQTLTYQDLSRIQREMYDVYGSGSKGTQWAVGDNMARREGYQVERVNQDIFSRQDLAALVTPLDNGQTLNCRVVATRRGVQTDGRGNSEYTHAIHVGKHPDTGKIHLYDPFPMRGDQMIECGDSLTEINHYFDNPETVTEEDGSTQVYTEGRNFNVWSKITPPSEAMGEESP